MKQRIAECTECGTRLQPLHPANEWAGLAVRHAAAHGVELPGPLIVFPLGPLLAHHAMVHDELDLETYISDYFNR